MSLGDTRARELCLALAEHPHGAFIWLVMGDRMRSAFTLLADAVGPRPVSIVTCPCGVRPCECG